MKSKEELIQDYIDGQLSGEERALFDQHWARDPQFRADVARQEELTKILASRLSEEAEALKTTLRNTEQAFRFGKSQKKGAGRIRRLIPILAAACVLLAATLFFVPWRSAPSVYEIPEMRSEIVRGAATTADQRYEDAVVAFNDRQYGESTKLLRDLHTQRPEILQYQFYLGLSLIGEEKFTEATGPLAALADGTSVFRNEATYYLAVALYKSGDTAAAVTRAKSVPEQAKIYPEAQRLLKIIQK